jgi:hypothetical protein
MHFVQAGSVHVEERGSKHVGDACWCNLVLQNRKLEDNPLHTEVDIVLCIYMYSVRRIL